MNMETKTQKFKRLFKEKKYKDALRIIKSFRKGLKDDEIRTLNIAWECISGKDSFYSQLGFHPDKIKSEAYEIMLKFAFLELKSMI